MFLTYNSKKVPNSSETTNYQAALVLVSGADDSDNEGAAGTRLRHTSCVASRGLRSNLVLSTHSYSVSLPSASRLFPEA